MSNHTQGPWRVVSRLGSYRPKSACYVVGPEATGQEAPTNGAEHAPIVCAVEWHRPGSADRLPVSRTEQEANAALLAAAPTLRDALEVILGLAVNCSGELAKAVTGQARAALARIG